MAQRQFLVTNEVKLSYIAFGDKGAPLLALHGHFSCGRTFAGLAEALGEAWRVVALDQRGHGWSDSTSDYSRDAYTSDAAALIQQLDLGPAVVLGHSLGGVNAYMLAAKHPKLVRALIIEDIGAVVDYEPLSRTDWPERFPNVRAVQNFLAGKYKNVTYFLESLVEYPDGWGFRFRYDHTIRSSQLLAGRWWADWLASTCPALLLHGLNSWAVATDHIREMVSRRPNTRLVEFPNCGHTIHDEDPDGFYKAVKEFLTSLEQQA